jgi:hypothetical protein
MISSINPEVWQGWAHDGGSVKRVTKDGIIVTVEPHPELRGFVARWENIPKGTGHNITSVEELTLKSYIDQHQDLKQGWAN